MEQAITDPIVLQAVTLRNRVAPLIQPHPAHWVRVLLLSMSILSPITAILYIISAIKRQSLLDRFWLFSVQANGFLQPNTCLVVPIFVLVYTIVSLGALISLQRDIKSHLITSETVILIMMAFPILLGSGWTKVWSTLHAIPPTRNGLRTWRIPNNSSNSRPLFKKVFNIMAVLVYAVPFVFSFIIMVPTAKHTTEINKIWRQYESSFLNMTQSQASQEVRIAENLDLLGQLSRLLEPSKSLLAIFKVLSMGYFTVLGALFLTTLYSYFHILRALSSQLHILRKSVETRRAISSIKLEKVIFQSPASHSDIEMGTLPVLDKTSSSGLFSLQESSCATTQVCHEWRGWLPSLQRGTEVEHSVWDTSLFTCSKEQWEKTHETLILEQYKVLKRFTVNAIWQASLLCIVIAFYMALNGVIFTNVLDVPKKHTLVDLCIFLITCSSMFWNLGIGILQGALSCVVAFSPIPNPPREPETIEDSDY